MKIEIHLYAMLRESIGASYLLEVTKGPMTSEMIIQEFKMKFPMFANTTLRLAIDHQFVLEDTVIQENQHIALIPPVSGG
jgi:molybdopterin synthase sulfur carrier subunit